MGLMKNKTLEKRQGEYVYEVKQVNTSIYRDGKFTLSELRQVLASLHGNKANIKREYESILANIDKEIEEIKKIISEIEADENSIKR